MLFKPDRLFIGKTFTYEQEILFRRDMATNQRL